jgi:hypothetical protein
VTSTIQIGLSWQVTEAMNLPNMSTNSLAWTSKKLPVQLEILLKDTLMCNQEIINVFQLKDLYTIKNITILGSLSYPDLISKYSYIWTSKDSGFYMHFLVQVIVLANHFNIQQQNVIQTSDVAPTTLPDNEKDTNKYCLALDITALKGTARALRRNIGRDLYEAIVETVKDPLLNTLVPTHSRSDSRRSGGQVVSRYSRRLWGSRNTRTLITIPEHNVIT